MQLKLQRREGNVIDLLTGFVAVLITAPVVVWVILITFFQRTTKNSYKATKISADLSTILFILSTAFATEVIFGFYTLPWIVILLIIILVFSLIRLWKKQQEVVLSKAIKSFWRMSFLLFFVFYHACVLGGILQRIFTV
jgi:hypothetical protein